MINVLKFADGSDLNIYEDSWKHLQAHPEITIQLLAVATAKIKPNPHQTENQGATIDLISEYGMWGIGNLIELENPVEITEITQFQFRRGRVSPTHVSSGVGKPTSLITIYFKKEDSENSYELKTAYASIGKSPGKEPICPSINPHTDVGKLERLKALESWSRYALIADPELPVFESSWGEMLLKYDNVYHQAE
ncbi:MAG: hypothetical protein AAGF07_01715 [Patescibacteria group bacterium]